MEREFKVGDRVIGVEAFMGKHTIVGTKGTIVRIDRESSYGYSVNFDKDINGHSCGGKCKYGHGWNVPASAIKLLETKKDKPVVVIYRNDREVIALDKSTGKKGVAKCSEKDTFDFAYGAKLALERLYGGVTESESESESEVKSKFKVGDKVKTTIEYYDLPKGVIGTIVKAEEHVYTVDFGFEYKESTHDCGILPGNTGLWLKESDLEKVD